MESNVRIVYNPTRYGTGDSEDPPELQDDVNGDFYYAWYSLIERGKVNAGGGCYESLADAITAVENGPGIGETVRWES